MSWDFVDMNTALSCGSRPLNTEWDFLNDTLFHGHPLLSWAFIDPLIRHYGTDNLLVGRYRQDLDVQALVLVQRRHPMLWQTFLPGQAPISPILSSPTFEVMALLRALPGVAIGIDLLCLDPEYSFRVDSTLEPRHERHEHCTTTTVSLDTTFDLYWSSRPKNLRKNMKRYFSRVDDSGHGTTLRVARSPADLQSALNRYGMLESAGWKGKAGTAIHPTNQQGRFYADVLGAFSAFNGARVYELYVGDSLAASRLCVARGGMLVVLKTTYDEALSHFAPGRLLLYRLLEREFLEKEFTEIEFYTNASHDSITWATATRGIFHLSYYRHPVFRRLITGTRRLRHALDHFTRPSIQPGHPSVASDPTSPNPP